MVNFDGTWLQFDGLAVPCQVIGALALDLDCGILRRDLLYQAWELRQQLPDGFRGGPEIAGFDDPALGVIGVAFLTPAHRKAIALAAVHDERHRLGGFAQRDRQAAGGEWIERAGVARAFGLEQPLHHGDGLGRSHADRLVEHHPAVNVALVPPRLIVWAGLFAATGTIPSVLRIGRNILVNAFRIADRLLDHVVCDGHGHQSTLPNLANLVNLLRGLFAPQVFAIISLFVPPRRIVRQHGSEYQAQILS